MPKPSKNRKPRPAATPPAAAASRSAATGSPQPNGRLRQIVLPAIVLVLLTAAVYAPVIHAGFIWDDDAYVTGNALLKDGAGLRAMWFELGSTTMYAPAFFTTLWLEYQAWGLSPRGYHLVNLVFHIACVLLLWRVLRRLEVRGDWLAAALFAVHPVMVESVAWVAELKNVQSGFFCLLTLLAYLRFRPLDGSPAPAPRARRAAYALALLFFALALLSKPVSVSLAPVILFLVWWKRGRIERGDLLAVAPLLVMGLAAGALAVYVEHRFGVATGAGFQMSLVERILVAGRAVWFYAAKLAWPLDLMSIYPRWRISGASWWQYLFPLGAAAVIAALWQWRERWGRGPLAAVLCFGVLVGPLTGVFNVAYHMYSFVADHFQYHAAAALLALAGAGLASLRSWSERGAQLGSAAVVLMLAFLSARHVPSYRDEKTRCLHTIASNPGAWSAMYNLGVALKAEGNAGEALRWYRAALKVTPENPEVLNNAGVALMSLGDASEAVRHYREALRIWPGYALAHNNLATALASLGDRESALREYREAVRLKPGYVEARANLAQLLAKEGRLDDAVQEYREALRIDPGQADLHHGLAVTLARSGDLPGAIAEYREALRVNPANPVTRNGLAMTHAMAGQPEEAARQFEEALRLDPRYAEAHSNYGTLLASQGRLDDAIAHYEEAVRLRPDYAEARSNLDLARRQAAAPLR